MIVSDPAVHISSSSGLQLILGSCSSSSFIQASQIISRIVLSNIDGGTESSLVLYLSGTSTASINLTNSSNQSLDSLEELCSICLQAMDEEKGDLNTVTGCTHVHHKQCISRLKKRSQNCSCSKGLLGDELGSSLTDKENGSSEEALLEITRSGILENIIFGPLGIIWVMCLVNVFLTFEVPCLVIFILITFFMGPYIIFQEKSLNIVSSIGLVIVFCFMFPLVLSFLLTVFIFQIFYTLYRTGSFYVKVFTCKMRWCNANRFIIKRTVTLTRYFFEWLKVTDGYIG